MSRENKIDYIEMPCRNLEDCKQFFATVFGWRFQDFGAKYCSFEDGRVAGGFYQSDGVMTPERGSALIVLYRADLEGTEAAVQAAGGRITKEIFSFPGGRRFHFADPTGNQFAVWSDS